MAAVVFGIEKPLHLKGLPWRQTRVSQRRVRGRTVYRDCDAEDSYIIKKKQNEAGLLTARKRKEEMRLLRFSD